MLLHYLEKILLLLSTADVFSGSMWVVLKRAGLLALKWGYRLGNGLLLQMLEVTIIGSHEAVKASPSNKSLPQLTRHTSSRTGCKRTVLGSLKRIIGPQTLQIWTHWTTHWAAMLKKYHKLQLKPKTIDELKVALQTIWEELPQEHKNTTRRWQTSPSNWLLAWLPMAVTSRICSQVHFQVWAPKNWLFQSYSHTTGENNAWNDQN